MTIKVIVVDDSAIMRRAITQALNTDPLINVVESAGDGIIALRKIEAHQPDVITLDIEMPRMDGLSTLRRIMLLHALPVIMFTGAGSQQNAIRALKFGAVDFVEKPTGTMVENVRFLQEYLTTKVKIASKVDVKKIVSLLRYKSASVPDFTHLQKLAKQKISMIAIGASTGGPVALEYILSHLPANFPVPILVAQHMPKGFTSSFANQLNKISPLSIREAHQHEKMLAGYVYVAPGGANMVVRSQNNVHYIALTATRPNQPTPSIDHLFDSVAHEYGAGVVGIILTGMGRDGARGLRSIRRRGGFTIAQDKETSVVFGMPKAAIELGGVENILPLAHIPAVTKKILGLRV